MKLLLLPAAILLAGLFCTASAGPAWAQGQCTGPPSNVRLIVDVQNVRSSNGLIAVTLYPDVSARFLARRGALYVGRVPARAPSTRVCIHLPSTGVYALAVYHDADGNRRINRTSLGLPDEDFGFSNNPRVLFGIPAFRSVRLNVPRTNMQATIRLREP